MRREHGGADAGRHAWHLLLGRAWGRGAVVVALNTLIAAMLVGIGYASADMPSELAASQTIGLTIWALVETAYAVVPRRWLALAVPVAVGLGAVGGPLAAGMAPGGVAAWARQRHAFADAVLIALVFGALITAFLVAGSRWHESDTALERERRRRAEAETAHTRANLATLQAQVEPHFLVNALATVSSLIDRDPARARRLLDTLSGHLRRALAHSRAGETELGSELDLIGGYLAILQDRLGDRLTYTIDAHPSLRACTVPPMLVQPLVENALKHGVEPARAGGTITVGAAWGPRGCVIITVHDTGAGPDPDQAPGTGLRNLRERLRLIYGDAAHLRLDIPPSGGTRATLVLPPAEAA